MITLSELEFQQGLGNLSRRPSMTDHNASVGACKGESHPKRQRERERFCDDSLRMANGVTTGVRYF